MTQTRSSDGGSTALNVRRKREKGALMAGVVAMLAIGLVWSAVGFQAWIDVLRRDNEAEMIFRAEEIVRGIQRYRRDHGGQGPQKLKDLMEPSPNKASYYMRREYDDPLIRDGKWGLLFMGPGGTIIDPSVTPGDGDAGIGLGLSVSGQGQDVGGAATPGNAGQLGGVGNRGSGAQEGGGLPIAGVKSLCEDRPFRVYRGETEYSKWLFTYLDIEGPGAAGKGKGKGKGGLNLRDPGARGTGKGRGNRPPNAGRSR